MAAAATTSSVVYSTGGACPLQGNRNFTGLATVTILAPAGLPDDFAAVAHEPWLVRAGRGLIALQSVILSIYTVFFWVKRDFLTGIQISESHHFLP
jgi:hypothetical protein